MKKCNETNGSYSTCNLISIEKKKYSLQCDYKLNCLKSYLSWIKRSMTFQPGKLISIYFRNCVILEIVCIVTNVKD